MDPAVRILDANLNRACEGLRVLEDVARFALAREDLCARVKSIRHTVSHALTNSNIDQLRLLASRDTSSDVGTLISTPTEGVRTTLADAATAAAKRACEALRSCEEAAKVLSEPAAAKAFEQARYHTYELDRLIRTSMGTAGVADSAGTHSHQPRAQWRLCVLVTRSLCKLPWQDVCKQAIQGGADCLQLREKRTLATSLEDGELLQIASDFVTLAHSLGAAAIINDRADIALLSGADGVHLGQGDLPAKIVRTIVGGRLLIGCSTGNITQARAATAAGADVCGVGPMFPTTTKFKDTIAGPEYLSQYLADPMCAHKPHLAIGGITPDGTRELAKVGCKGIAVSSYVCGSNSPREACAKLREALGS